MTEIFIVERVVVMLNGARSTLPIVAFADAQAATNEARALDARVAELLRFPVQTPDGVSAFSALLSQLGIKGIGHAVTPSGLRSGLIATPGGPRIIM